MRLSTLIGIIVLAGTGSFQGDAGEERVAERVARLVKQLGHGEFAQREAATRALDAIGEPAVAALRKAASGDDAEIRRRAQEILEAITSRIRAAAARKELPKWQGEWAAEGGQKLAIKGDQWASSTPSFGPVSGTLKDIEVHEKMTHVDLVVEAGPTKGQTCKVIFRLEGNTLHYCGTYDPVRPSEFKTQGNSVYAAWKRVKPEAAAAVQDAVAQAPEVQLDCPAFSTDLPLAESKEAIHRVVLKCQLGDGGAGTLILDPSIRKLDEFGNHVAGGVQAPLVTLECTLKLVKNQNGRRLYELRGPKLVSRLSLAVHANDPLSEARLLVHGKDGEVRYVVELQHPRFPPCHPGCFPAGTTVRVPDGTKLIERIREGDLVTTLDADGKPSPTPVTGVFVTRNRLLQVRTDDGTLLTTETQRLALHGGGYRPAGELKKGDRVWRWGGAQRQAARVLQVLPTDQEAEVVNLLLGEPKGFIAGDFLVQSKPPLPPRP